MISFILELTKLSHGQAESLWPRSQIQDLSSSQPALGIEPAACWQAEDMIPLQHGLQGPPQ